MMGKKDNAERTQVEIASLEDLVPRNHLVRKLNEAIDMSFIYEEVKERYKQDKKTIERVFADAKEKHRMRYTPYTGVWLRSKWSLTSYLAA